MAQHVGQPLAFEVIVIRPSAEDGKFALGPELRHGRLTVANQKMRVIVARAYGVDSSLVTGPKWLDSARFDISAKAPEGVADGEMRPMLQTLLRERFGLISHTSNQQTHLYELRIARGGIRMALYPSPPIAGAEKMAQFPMLRGTGATSEIAKLLSEISGVPVIDKTGTNERYDFLLSYSSPSSQTAPASEGAPPDLFSAVREQLGLELRSAIGRVEVLVVDRMNQIATAN